MRSRVWIYPKPWTSAAASAPDRTRVHALVLAEDSRTVEAARRLRAAGFEIADVLSPHPLHGIEEALGLPPTRIGMATLAGGISGALLAVGFQSWVGVFDWPMNIGGKSYLALPALMPVTFEVAVLLAAFGTVGALIGLNRLRPRGAAMQGPLARATDDQYVILVSESDARFDVRRLRALAEDVGAERLVEGWRVQ